MPIVSQFCESKCSSFKEQISQLPTAAAFGSSKLKTKQRNNSDVHLTTYVSPNYCLCFIRVKAPLHCVCSYNSHNCKSTFLKCSKIWEGRQGSKLGMQIFQLRVPVDVNEKLKLNFSRCFLSFEVSFVIWYLVTTSSAQNYKQLPLGYILEAHENQLKNVHAQSIKTDESIRSSPSRKWYLQVGDNGFEF